MAEGKIEGEAEFCLGGKNTKSVKMAKWKKECLRRAYSDPEEQRVTRTID